MSHEIASEALYRELPLSVGDQSDKSTDIGALRERLGADAMEVLRNLTGIASALSGIIREGAGLAILVDPSVDGSDTVTVRLIGIERASQ